MTFLTKPISLPLPRTLAAFLVVGVSLGMVTHAQAQTALPSVGFVVPEWKSNNGEVIVRARGRVFHDFYSIDRDFDAGTINGETTNNGLRALRLGIDGQLSKSMRFRADANLTGSAVNWADVYLGYNGQKYEFFVGQQRLSTALETASSATVAPLPEPSLVTVAFGQNVRNFGAIARVKGNDWQVVGGLYHGNLNAGDIFGDDVIRAAQVRGSYAPRHRDRDVLHIGASVRVRDTQSGSILRYGTRPAPTNFGPRTLDSGTVSSGDTTFSLEGLMVRGSVIITAEHHILQADTLGGTANLNGSYIEGAWYLTGETRRYAVGSGNLGSVRPKKSIRAGGHGALALVGRLERLDQSDAAFGARAGRVEAASLGAAWVPVEFIMLRLAASYARYDGPVAARRGTSNAFLARAQFSF
jgi:phosphate-selective porin OprO/OprP